MATHCAVTMVTACQIHCFPKVGINTNLVGTCVDHSIHQAVDESVGNNNKLDKAIQNVLKFVNFLVESCKTFWS